MPDTTITCKDCQQSFTLTEKETEWYERMGFSIPKRCKTCKTAKKLQNARQDN